MKRFEIDALGFGGDGAAVVLTGGDAGARFDEIIDVRSPGEFAEDHVPGAHNLPVLDDAERARVGTVYVQDDKFKARKIGAALVSANIARHLDAHFAGKPRDYRPLVLCWRGGQRSGSMALVLDQIGWRVGVLDEGYRGYRRRVVDRLYHRPPWFEVVLLSGPTGVGKTEVLRRVAGLGWPTLDLEGLARHKGSVFGTEPGAPQPTQKRFEGAVLAALDEAGRSGRPIVVEAESSKIGQLLVPPALWKAMQSAPRIHLDAPISARARHIASEYAWITQHPEQLDGLLTRLAPLRGWEAVRAWRRKAAAGDMTGLAADLIETHYDPAYRQSAARASSEGAAGFTPVRMSQLDAASFDDAAAQVARTLAAASPAT